MDDTDRKRRYTIDFAITGTGHAAVEAETEEEAIKKARDGDFIEDPEIFEWEMNTDESFGGYLDAMLEAVE